MGEKYIDRGVEREIVKVACAVTHGNPHGYRVDYRDQMGADEVEFVEGAEVEHEAEEQVEEDVPSIKWTKAQLTEYLTQKNISFEDGATKAQLLELCVTD